MHGQFVDAIGTEAVVKLIQQSKLCKFIVYRQGSGKGSIPVFECIDTDSTHKCVEAFKDWANTILRVNPYNTIPYDLLLWKNASAREIESELDDDDDGSGRTKAKRNKIKISFSLASYQNMGMMQGMGGGQQIDVQKAVTEALRDYDQRRQIKDLQDQLREAREGGDDDDDDGGGLNKIAELTGLLKEIRLAGKGKKAAEIAGDLDDDDDEEEDLEEEEDDEIIEEEEEEDLDDDGEDEELEETPRRSMKGKKSSSDTKLTEEKKERLKTAIRILYKYDADLDKDLLILAKLAKNNTPMFKTMLSNLRTLK